MGAVNWNGSQNINNFFLVDFAHTMEVSCRLQQLFFHNLQGSIFHFCFILSASSITYLKSVVCSVTLLVKTIQTTGQIGK